MASWRDQILKEFTPQVAHLTLVADPDGLLLEEGVIEGIRDRGFELIPFEDHVAFRYAYESKYRSRWDRGELTDLVVVLRAPTADLDSLPYDLLQAGRKLSFNLGDLFPNLSYAVLEALDGADLDALYSAQTQHKPGQLGDNATKDFVLRNVFEIAAELVRQPSELLRVLLRRHHRGSRLPAILDERLIQVLRQSGRFDDWPLEQTVPDRLAFFAFLQERWPIFLDRLATGSPEAVGEGEPPFGLEFAGPVDLPFDHDDVRVYIDDLFFEGLLRPVHHEKSDEPVPGWVAAGLVTSPEEDRSRRLEGLLAAAEGSLPSSEARHQDWLAFAQKWAELTALTLEGGVSIPEELVRRSSELQSRLDPLFFEWMLRRYHTLHNQPPTTPAMVHHIPWMMAGHIAESREARVALVVVDGLSLDQWVTLRDVVLAQRSDIQTREASVFAWVPTLTPVSRQATFAGRPPLFFPMAIQTTNKEGAHWTQFWTDHGLTAGEVLYNRSLGEDLLGEMEEMVAHPKARVIGVVIGKVDKIMHGMELGAAGMHNQVRQWAEQGIMADVLDVLLDGRFRVFLTSDHGNIEAQGCGRPTEGVLAEQRGERVRIYSDELLRRRVKQEFPDACEWPSLGLPDDYLPLTASGRSAFITRGHKTVAHGGLSIQEVIVPLVSVERRSR